MAEGCSAECHRQRKRRINQTVGFQTKNKMIVLILAAGYGTRLYPLVKDTPKALLDINGRPLLNYILDKIEQVDGLNGVIVVTNNKFHKNFEHWKKDLGKFVEPIEIINDGTDTPEDRLGSIGDINFVLRQRCIDDDLLVIGGDNLFDYSLEDYVRFSKTKNPSVVIGLYDIHDLTQATKFGVVKLDTDGKIISFEEKSQQPQSTLIAMCCYYLPRKVLSTVRDYLSETKRSDTSGDYIRWLTQKYNVYGFQFTGRWYDIGSIESYKEAVNKFK